MLLKLIDIVTEIVSFKENLKFKDKKRVVIM